MNDTTGSDLLFTEYLLLLSKRKVFKKYIGTSFYKNWSFTYKTSFKIIIKDTYVSPRDENIFFVDSFMVMLLLTNSLKLSDKYTINGDSLYHTILIFKEDLTSHLTSHNMQNKDWNLLIIENIVYSVRSLERSEWGGSHGCPGRLWDRFLWQVYTPSKASRLLSFWYKNRSQRRPRQPRDSPNSLRSKTRTEYSFLDYGGKAKRPASL